MPVAIITGASRGFGRAMATDLAKDGWKLVIDGRRAEDPGPDEEGLAALGGGVRAIVGDVTDPDHRAALVGAAAELGGVDLLVNNASELGPSPLPNLDRFPLDVLREVYEVNVIAPLGLVQLALAAAEAFERHRRLGVLGRRRRGLRGMGWVRLVQGRPRPAAPGPGRRGADVARVSVRSW